MILSEFEQTCDEQRQNLLNFLAARHQINATTGEDVVQETLLRLYKTAAYAQQPYQSPAELRPNRAPNWLVKAADFTARDMRRQRLRELTRQRRAFDEQAARDGLLIGVVQHEPDGEPASPYESRRRRTRYEVGAHAEQGDAEAQRLNDKTRALGLLVEVDPLAYDAAKLVYLDRLDWKQAAQKVGARSGDALRVQVSRAFRRVRERLAAGDRPAAAPADEDLDERLDDTPVVTRTAVMRTAVPIS